MQNEHAKELRKILRETSFLTLPGVYDCLSAKIAEEAGFQALFLSGGALAYSVLGRPDFGFLSLAEFGTAIKYIVFLPLNAPLICRCDNGFKCNSGCKHQLWASSWERQDFRLMIQFFRPIIRLKWTHRLKWDQDQSCENCSF